VEKKLSKKNEKVNFKEVHDQERREKTGRNGVNSGRERNKKKELHTKRRTIVSGFVRLQENPVRRMQEISRKKSRETWGLIERLGRH